MKRLEDTSLVLEACACAALCAPAHESSLTSSLAPEKTRVRSYAAVETSLYMAAALFYTAYGHAPCARTC